MFNGKVSFSSKENEFLLKANSIDFFLFLRNLKIEVPQDKKIICPFYFHKSGLERTPSLYLYPDTNSFYCFGCQTGGGPADFLSALKNISKGEAIEEILSIHQEGYLPDYDSLSVSTELQNLILNFNSSIRINLSSVRDNFSKKEKIEEVIKIYDTITQKYNLNFDGYLKLIEKLNIKLQLL